jgi:cytochrome c peroxidase
VRVAAVGLLLAATACVRTADVILDPAELAVAASLALPDPLPTAPSRGNLLADDPRAAELGRLLFFDTRLSSDGAISCASCHLPEKRFSGTRPTTRIGGPEPRDVPTLVGAGWLPFLYWDGRKDSLWSQALEPLESPHEHALDRQAVVQLVREHHGPAFAALGGAGGSVDEAFALIGRTIGAFVRTLAPEPAPFDRWIAAQRRGDETGGGELSLEAVRGLRAFIGPANCISCHNGFMLTDRQFHNLGLPQALGRPASDRGRAAGIERLVSDPFRCRPSADDSCDELRFLARDLPDWEGAFKTPTLRNVAETAPYMHDGRFASLEEVVDFYRALPGEAQLGRRDATLRPLARGVRTGDLVAFLRSLSSGPKEPGRPATSRR